MKVPSLKPRLTNLKVVEALRDLLNNSDLSYDDLKKLLKKGTSIRLVLSRIGEHQMTDYVAKAGNLQTQNLVTDTETEGQPVENRK